MRLNGYRRACGQRNGGLREIALVQADAVSGVSFDAGTGMVSEVRLVDGGAWAVYRFKEDEAAYAERAVVGAAGALVTHVLSFTLECMSPDAARAVGELVMGAPNGLLAILVTNNGDRFLVGYSERFGLQYPLRLKTAAGESGRRITDVSTEVITLESIDTEKACACAIPPFHKERRDLSLVCL
ncbi:MAG: hypothetical protein FWE10_00995 [Rikenellaceae bacterium]|nr:hypothetical protein [Rikenellaceae bacterium]MCL2692313.1 hypothetical protein [Rikenellaceae bacterium]